MMPHLLRPPRPLRQLLERLPARPPSLVFARLLNLALRPVIRRGELQSLFGKAIVIRVTDAGLRLGFTIDAQGFSSVAETALPALTISATLHDFYLLANRLEDPDTLFFNRRLVVEGDTELALVTKNALDGLDLDSLPLLAPLRWFASHDPGKIAGPLPD